ncbi:hypothetical protein [Massilia sp. BKSP1R2A-1]|uniref:hypothetical protein n=1 Tax=Massilia sp. BKSP1R2A-1 TaxID=3422595 RepID=UPI003D3411F1
MAADSNVTLDRAVIEHVRRTYRDRFAAPNKVPVDKVRVLAHLRALLAELQKQEGANGDA